MIKFIGFSTIALCLATTAVVGQTNDWVFEKANKLSPAVNSDAEDIMPVLTEDGNTMYFVRGMHAANAGGTEGGHDIWMSKKAADGSWGTPVNNLPTLNNEENNAVIGINSSSDNLFLINAYKKQNVGDDVRGISLAEDKSGSWGKPSFVKLPSFQTNTPEQGYYVSPEGDLIIMSVNSESSLGGEDLYVSEKKDGKWGEPVHMGNVINSKGFEMSPFLSKDRKNLFFASNGFGGLGDADIFVSTRQGDSWTQWSAPVNMGDRINSAGFDAYLTMTADSTFYFASNRDGSRSDLYSTHFYEEPPVEVTTVVVDTLPVIISPVVLTAPNLYFDKDSYALTADEKKVLDDVATKMKANPLSKVELIGHTDVTFTDEHNARLAKNRAKAAYKYLTGTKGVASSRVSQKSFGETQPVNTCSEADCSDAQHAKNRRVEIRFS